MIDVQEPKKRKLASIQKVIGVRSIEGADRVEVCQIQGYECVVAKKDNFKVGDLVVYVECDSILPDKPEFEFLRETKFRIKIRKMRGQVSQGIVFPLTILQPYGTIVEQDGIKKLILKKDL
jgi:RNA ligase (TIGR02306 family)